MQAELLRIVGEHFLKQGHIQKSMEHLLQSIEKNKREARTWMAYGRLNEVIYL